MKRRGHTKASQCDLTPLAPLNPTSGSPFNSAHRFDFTNRSIASRNFFSSELDQDFLIAPGLADEVGSAGVDLGFFGVLVKLEFVSDGRLGGIAAMIVAMMEKGW